MFARVFGLSIFVLLFISRGFLYIKDIGCARWGNVFFPLSILIYEYADGTFFKQKFYFSVV